MSQQFRKFIVRDKKTGTDKEITGVVPLAREVGVTVRTIPDVFLFKVTFNGKIVTEITSNK